MPESNRTMGTPGPWKRSGVRGKLFQMHGLPLAYHAVIADDVQIAAVWFNEKTGEGFADAALIAAAPELLEALKDCLEQAESCWRDHYGNNPEGSAEPAHIAKGRAALAKAGG
jgi:hypothetical protein